MSNSRDRRITSYVTEEMERELEDLGVLSRRLKLGKANMSDVVWTILTRYAPEYRKDLERIEAKNEKARK